MRVTSQGHYLGDMNWAQNATDWNTIFNFILLNLYNIHYFIKYIDFIVNIIIIKQARKMNM